MKEIFALIPAIINLITPDPEFKGIRLEKKQLKLAQKKRRIAKRLYKGIKKEFKKDGFTSIETQILQDLKAKLIQRKIDLINNM